MSHYKSYNSYSDAKFSILGIIICIGIFLMLMFFTNSCTASDWNDGICPKCEVRYELRGASKRLKYYACPECGKEVERY